MSFRAHAVASMAASPSTRSIGLIFFLLSIGLLVSVRLGFLGGVLLGAVALPLGLAGCIGIGIGIGVGGIARCSLRLVVAFAPALFGTSFATFLLVEPGEAVLAHHVLIVHFLGF